MKKLTVLLVAVVLALSMTACGAKDDSGSEQTGRKSIAATEPDSNGVANEEVNNDSSDSLVEEVSDNENKPKYKRINSLDIDDIEFLASEIYGKNQEEVEFILHEMLGVDPSTRTH